MQILTKCLVSLLCSLMFALLLIFGVALAGVNTGSGNLDSYDVDYWWINDVNEGDTVLLNIQAETFPYSWHSKLYYSNLTLLYENNTFNGHAYQFIANETDDYLLRLNADYNLSFAYTIESIFHDVSEQALITASGNLSAYDVDYWWINDVNEGDTVLLNIQAETFPYSWHSKLYYSNLTLLDEIDEYDTHLYQFIADKTDNYLLRLNADYNLSFNYTIESTHNVSEQPMFTVSEHLAAYDVDYWWVNYVKKGDVVLLSVQTDTFPFSWHSKIYYSNLTLLDEVNDYDTHIYEFVACKTGDYMFTLSADYDLSFDYTIECTHQVSTEPDTHNVAITNVSTDKTTLFQGQQLTIHVNVANTGSFTETVNVTAFHDSTPIQTILNQELMKDESTTLDFFWITKGVAAGSYTISANCTTVQNEIDTEDNSKVDGVVTIESDDTPPYIDTPVQNPPRDNVPPYQEVTVSANVTDEESGVENVILFFTTNNGTAWENRTMNLNLSISLYQTTIPGQPAQTWVKFKIVASDYAGNNATKDGTEPYCTYQVIAEFPSFLIALLFTLTTSLATFTLKKPSSHINK